jgi:hypothetical protein
MPGFNSCTDSIIPSTLNQEVVAHNEFPRASAQLVIVTRHR